MGLYFGKRKPDAKVGLLLCVLGGVLAKCLFGPLAGDNFPHDGTAIIAWDHWILWV